MKTHNPSFLRTLPVLVAVLVAGSLGSRVLGEIPAPGPPKVGDTYQEYIDAAWKEAVEGHNPTATCAGLKGRVMGTQDSSAFRALFACNVDIPVRYFETYLDSVEAGEKTCQNFIWT